MDEKLTGERIAALRTAKNLTQQQLAEKLGVSDKTVSKWEVGGGYPDITSIPVLAETLGVTTDYLLGSRRKQQKLFVFFAQSTRKINDRNVLISDIINSDYLDKGWMIISSSMSSEEENSACMLVLEKEVID